MLLCLQEAAKEACPKITSSSSLLVENDNSATLQAIFRASARQIHFTDDILHYQIVFQYWDNTDHNTRRSLLLTNSKSIFILYSTIFQNVLLKRKHLCKLKKSTVQDIANVTFAKDNTKIVVIAFKPQSILRWSPSSSFLKCQHVENAERLISDIRKSLSSWIERAWNANAKYYVTYCCSLGCTWSSIAHLHFSHCFRLLGPERLCITQD